MSDFGKVERDASLNLLHLKGDRRFIVVCEKTMGGRGGGGGGEREREREREREKERVCVKQRHKVLL